MSENFKFEKGNILVLDDGGTQVLPLVKSLSRLGYFVHLVYCSKLTYGYPSRFVKKRYLFTEMSNIDAFGKFVLSVLSKEKFETVIPLDDNSAEVVSKFRDEISKYCDVVVPNYDVFKAGFDKHSLMDLCQKNGFPHPPTTLVEGGAIDHVDYESLVFPILIKPNHTCGGRGMTLVNTKEELLKLFPLIYKEYGNCHLQSYIPHGGAQVEVQLYINEKKRLTQSSVIYKFRWYPESGGSSCCNVSHDDDAIVSICYNILKELNWVGFADFDTIQDPRTGQLLVMEINPRLPACVKTAFAAGIDWGNVLVSEYKGEPHPFYKKNKKVYLRHLGMDSLWFYYSKNRFKTKPSWFKLLGRNIYYQDMSCFSDPLPFFFGSIGNLRKQLSHEFRKSKAGITEKKPDLTNAAE